MIFELHVHSKYSFDSILDPIKIVKYAKKKGLDGIAITDHNTIKGGIIAQKANTLNDFYIIIGSEINTDSGDIIGLFLNEEIKSRNSINVIEEIHEQDGIAILPHPYRSHNLNDDLINKIDLLEVFNARSTRMANERAMNLALKFNKKYIAGSDAHFLSEIGLAKNIFRDNYNFKINILNGSSELVTSLSPTYLQPLSQIIKAAKEKAYRNIPPMLMMTTIESIKNLSRW